MGSSQLLIKVLDKVSDRIIENKVFLTDLDRPIGDSDHGLNMAKGFTVVKSKLTEMEGQGIDAIFKMVAMSLISTVGGASGPLYGTAFLEMSKAMKDKTEINKPDLANVLDAAIAGIIRRGKAQKGEKTMLDALIPASEALRKKLEEGGRAREAFRAAADAAAEGVEYTKTIIATKGRASYLGERSLGHQDPGATSSYLMLDTVAKVLNGE